VVRDRLIVREGWLVWEIMACRAPEARYHCQGCGRPARVAASLPGVLQVCIWCFVRSSGG
jgi:hypothetical protein